MSTRAIFCTPCFLANAKKKGRKGGLAARKTGKIKKGKLKIGNVKKVKVTKDANCHKPVPQKIAQQTIRVNAMLLHGLRHWLIHGDQ